MPEPAPASADASADPPRRDNLYTRLATHLAKIAKTAPGERAALVRLRPDALQPHQLAALARALHEAGLSPEHWHVDTWPRWAMIVHGMAMTGHDGSKPLGKQLAIAGIAESRVTKLLTARGDAFNQLLPRVFRLLASQNVKPNWSELGKLVLNQSSLEREKRLAAEQNRLALAGAYFSELARIAAKK